MTVGDDGVGDHVTRLFQVCFLRPCSEEGSDAAKPIVNDNSAVKIAT